MLNNDEKKLLRLIYRIYLFDDIVFRDNHVCILKDYHVVVSLEYTSNLKFEGMERNKYYNWKGLDL